MTDRIEIDQRDREYWELLDAVKRVLCVSDFEACRFIRQTVRESLKSALMRQKTDELKRSVDVEVDEWTSWWANVNFSDYQATKGKSE